MTKEDKNAIHQIVRDAAVHLSVAPAQQAGGAAGGCPG